MAWAISSLRIIPPEWFRTSTCAAPMCRRTWEASRTMSHPATRACPDVGGRSVVSIFTVADFPAPFRPRSPKMTPDGIRRVRPSTAASGPNRRVRRSVSTAAGPSPTRSVRKAASVVPSAEDLFWGELQDHPPPLPGIRGPVDEPPPHEPLHEGTGGRRAIAEVLGEGGEGSPAVVLEVDHGPNLRHGEDPGRRLPHRSAKEAHDEGNRLCDLRRAPVLGRALQRPGRMG